MSIKVLKTDALMKLLLEVSIEAGIWDKRRIVPFPVKDELRYNKEYKGINLSITASKMYKVLLLRILPHNQPNLRNKKDGFALAGPFSTHFGSEKNIGRIKKPEPLSCNTVDFSKVLNSIHRRKFIQKCIHNNKIITISSVWKYFSQLLINFHLKKLRITKNIGYFLLHM